eukprot:TRINITY_DN1689_c0_g1_i2.p1 TRINITY_DN1689_c0_g1~~TRINITY_DN1689_c0_g1_i2.p1  ORF type:complete len:454 (-),score=74.31 TRINITY_DN1689_c0_g1_i2:36-1397(-)
MDPIDLTGNMTTPSAPARFSSRELIEMEYDHAAHTYHPLPVCFSRASGVHVWDPEGKKYYDFLSAYSAVNQGHCHPRILAAMIAQAQKCTLSSRAFYNDVFPVFAKFVTEFFGYEMVLPMNTGAEAVETAVKVARKWAYSKKGIPDDQAIIICARECFHGRTMAAVSMSTDPSCYAGFGPLVPGFVQVDHNDVKSLEDALNKYGSRVCAFLVEPIQGEAGINVPAEGYLSECHRLCKQHNVLFIADEIQTGLARTGKMLACDWDNVHPDVLILGKAASGGLLPLSLVLSSREVMLCIKAGEHGSTYGGNPLASAVGIAALQVLKDEDLANKANANGMRFRQDLSELSKQFPFIQTVRGKGLLNAIVIDPEYKRSAWELCLLFAQRGLLAKPTHNNIIRLAPPLVITPEQLNECVQIIRQAVHDLDKMSDAEVKEFCSKMEAARHEEMLPSADE